MRLKLILQPVNNNVSIHISYEYYLSAAIYRWLEHSSPELSRFLHDQGYSPQGMLRRFKHFCFSQLFIKNTFIKDDRLFFKKDNINWYIGMPIEENLKHLVIGIFNDKTLFIEKEENKFVIEQVEIIPEPAWNREMKFKTISPITASVPLKHNGKLIARYLKADDPDVSEVLKKNLLLRYESLYDRMPEDKELICTTDIEYIKRRGGANRVSKLVAIKKGLPEETKVRGFRCPVTLKGSIELIKLAYESGLGEKGSMGFGMLEVI